LLISNEASSKTAEKARPVHDISSAFAFYAAATER